MTLKAAQLRNAWLPPMIMDAAFGPAIWQATAVNLIFPLGINKQAHGCGGGALKWRTRKVQKYFLAAELS